MPRLESSMPQGWARSWPYDSGLDACALDPSYGLVKRANSQNSFAATMMTKANPANRNGIRVLRSPDISVPPNLHRQAAAS
jgi:hypothetical protein